jgi:cytochrome P450
VRPSLADLRRLRDGPHDFLLGLARTRGKAVRLRVGPVALHLLNHPTYVQEVLVAGHRVFTKDTFQYRLLASVTGDGLLTMDGPEWLARRRLEQPLFHREAVRQWAGLMVAATGRLLDSWDLSASAGADRDIADDMLRVALDVVTGTLFPAGFDYDRNRVLEATMMVLSHIMRRARTLGLVPASLPTKANRRFRGAIGELDSVLYDMIRFGRAAGPGAPDLLAHLMFDAEGRPSGLSDRQMRDELLTMIIAGHETVASALSWSWHLLALHPDVERRLASEASRVPADLLAGDPLRAIEHLDFASMIFDETLRLYPPAWVITRKAMRTASVAGIEIPAGGLVAISPYVLQRDETFWKDPDRFDPDRFDDSSESGIRNAYIPFGAGPHLCIGLHMARLEARILLGMAAARFRLVPVPERPPLVEPGVTLHPKDGLWMRIERRG